MDGVNLRPGRKRLRGAAASHAPRNRVGQAPGIALHRAPRRLPPFQAVAVMVARLDRAGAITEEVLATARLAPITDNR